MRACISFSSACRFPRLYAAASLKQHAAGLGHHELDLFSAALCRGLIEAVIGEGDHDGDEHGFPRLYAAASLKLLDHTERCRQIINVFRGFMPRPH